jgi:hypothetical protein
MQFSDIGPIAQSLMAIHKKRNIPFDTADLVSFATRVADLQRDEIVCKILGVLEYFEYSVTNDGNQRPPRELDIMLEASRTIRKDIIKELNSLPCRECGMTGSHKMDCNRPKKDK